MYNGKKLNCINISLTYYNHDMIERIKSLLTSFNAFCSQTVLLLRMKLDKTLANCKMENHNEIICNEF